MRFQVIGRLTITLVTLDLLLAFRFKKLSRRPHAFGRNPGRQLFQQCRIARQVAGFHQIRDDRNIAASLGYTLLEGPSTVSDLESDIPKEADKALDLVRFPLRAITGPENQ